MANAPTGPAQYLARFSEQTIAGSKYALAKLGVDRANCSLKIEEYLILCVPFQLGFKRSIFMASLSNQELVFFQKYANKTVGLSLALNPNKRPEPVKFFLRCNLSNIGQMKGRENVGLFVVDYKASPDEMVNMLGSFLENQERIKAQYEDYGKTPVKMTPEVSKLIGYNMYAVVTQSGAEPRRIQVFSLSSKTLEHMEAAGAPVRQAGTVVTYQLFFKKYRIVANGKVKAAGILPQGLVRTVSDLEFSPELVEILDDYWYTARTNLKSNPLSNPMN
jgi:hypothetical protein